MNPSASFAVRILRSFCEPAAPSAFPPFGIAVVRGFSSLYTKMTGLLCSGLALFALRVLSIFLYLCFLCFYLSPLFCSFPADIEFVLFICSAFCTTISSPLCFIHACFLYYFLSFNSCGLIFDRFSMIFRSTMACFYSTVCTLPAYFRRTALKYLRLFPQ